MVEILTKVDNYIPQGMIISKLNSVKILSLNDISYLYCAITCKFRVCTNTVGILESGTFLLHTK